MEFNWFDHAFAFLIILVIPAMSLRSQDVTEEIIDSLPPKKHLFYTNGLMLIIGALLVLTSWNFSERPWLELGIDFIRWSDQVLYLCLGIFIFYFIDLTLNFINTTYIESKLEDLHYIIPINWIEFRSYIFLAVSAGICEEIIFRGFLITYLNHYFTGLPFSFLLVILIPAVVFSVSHLYQGWWAVLKIMILASLFGLIFIMSESLILVICIHILIDIFSGLAGVIGHKKAT